ncbi:hypothetical protein V494_00375 [Pseudogymnoascus sp. VKM F-4513 (FW-928)]|nr:hypothetical protein V494_00375 [Pseudogymnoascus sp. VKM F-4513 (FW-928)]
MRPVPRLLLAPREAADATRGRPGTLEGGGGGGGAQRLHDVLVDEGGDLGGGGHPAGEEGLLGEHVDRAPRQVSFAGDLEGDAFGKEDFNRSGEELLDALLPDGAAIRLGGG